MFYILFLLSFAPDYIAGVNVQNELFGPLNTPSLSPINIQTSTVQRIVTKTPLTVHSTPSQLINVTNKGNIVQLDPNPGNNAHIFGGIFGWKKYIFEFARIYITQCPNNRSGNAFDGVGSPLQPTIILRNINYPTFQEATEKPDGVVVLATLVVIAKEFQEEFSPFQDYLLRGALREPGSSFQIPAGLLLSWFDHVNEFKEYYAYRGSCYDMCMKQHYGATVIIPSTKMAGLSFEQYKAFRNVLGDNQKPIEAVTPIFSQGSRTVFLASGVLQIIT